jgi:hypothetical protein
LNAVSSTRSRMIRPIVIALAFFGVSLLMTYWLRFG